MSKASLFLQQLWAEGRELRGGLLISALAALVQLGQKFSPKIRGLVDNFPIWVFYVISVAFILSAAYHLHEKQQAENQRVQKEKNVLKKAQAAAKEPKLQISHGDGGRFLDSISPRSIDGSTYVHRLCVASLGDKELKKCNLSIISINGLPENEQSRLKKDTDTWEKFKGNYDIYKSEPLYFDFITTHKPYAERAGSRRPGPSFLQAPWSAKIITSGKNHKIELDEKYLIKIRASASKGNGTDKTVKVFATKADHWIKVNIEILPDLDTPKKEGKIA